MNVIVGEAVEVSVGGIEVSVKVGAGVRVEGIAIVVSTGLEQPVRITIRSVHATKNLGMG